MDYNAINVDWISWIQNRHNSRAVVNTTSIMPIYMYAYTHTYTKAHIPYIVHAYTYAYIHTYTYKNTYTRAYMNAYIHICTHTCIYRVSQEEYARFREGVLYVKVYRYNPKHLCPKLNGYGDNGQRKVWFSGGSMYCTCQVTVLSMSVLECGVI